MNSEEVVLWLNDQADAYEKVSFDVSKSQLEQMFLNMQSEPFRNAADLIESLRQQLAEANAKVAFLQGDGSIVGYPWDAPYSDGFEMATAKYRERIIATEEMYEAKIADLTARLEAQEASEPVPVGYFLRGPDGYLEEVDNETSDTIRLYGTPQPTPTVKAAVAAAYRKAAEVCDSITMLSDTDWAKKTILAIPHDDSALREFGLAVINAWIDRDLSEQETVDFVLGEKK